jgi:hypothetical protein
MRRLNTLFGTSPELKALTTRARHILALQAIWEKVTPSPLDKHSYVGPLHHGRLTVYTRSSAVAAKLKMQLNGLLGSLQNHGVEVTSICVEVQVESIPRPLPKAPLRITATASHSLYKLAEELPDSPLKQALQRLASRA